MRKNRPAQLLGFGGLLRLIDRRQDFAVGMFEALEAQMCNWVPDNPDGSPDRVDALVWALTELMLNQTDSVGLPLFGGARTF